MIRVLLVHDTWLMRSALTALLESAEGIEASSACWESAPDQAHSLQPDLCVVDADCPGSSRLPDHPTGQRCELLVLATSCRPGVLRRAAQARALGFVNKDASPTLLLNAIRLVAAGKRYVDASLAPDLVQAADMKLTPRELSVLALAAEGASVPETAGTLRLSKGTVRNYMSAIIRKTNARNWADAVRISNGAGWV
ncbi:response regulator transcription factor [Streptomyces sp. NPDC002889]|uniref:response regulator transcription factor n=1 Tax=Streptomyces sp. NPDC002889 TaxID=3364669 RepID=UPI0036CF482F